MKSSISRGEFIKVTTAGSLSLAAVGCAAKGMGLAPSASDSGAGDRYNTYFGDLHNHSAVGYARGSLERVFDIARNHLDFCAHTPHGYWHDIGRYEGGIEERWHKGFDVTRDRWPDVVATVRRYDAPGKFVPILGYEQHSTSLGDFHILFPHLDGEYARFDDIREFQAFARKQGAILVPHHPANRRGERGANPDCWDRSVSPVIEIFSEWGNAEHDRGPYPYIRHSHGGRWTGNTLHQFLQDGRRMGVVASTDDHLGYPGAYREGLAAVLAPELTREAIFEALRNRRTYAVTGDRIRVQFHINTAMMGRELPYVRERHISAEVVGWDQVDRVEVLKNNRVIHRDFPMDRVPTAASWDQPVLVRVEFGWGPWAALGRDRTCDWDIDVKVEGGVLEGMQTCFTCGPYDESRRDKVLEQTDRRLRVQSFTARREMVDDVPTKAVVLKLQGGPATRLTINLAKPTEKNWTLSLKDLAASSEVLYTGIYPNESLLVHRLVFAENYRTTFAMSDVDEGRETNWYYLRVVQANGQLAWSSPVWVEGKG